MVALNPGITLANEPGTIPCIGHQSPGKNYCFNNPDTRTSCGDWATNVSAVTGNTFAYFSANNTTNNGFGWAGLLNAGLSFGGLTRAANTSQLIANGAGLTLNGSQLFASNEAINTLSSTRAVTVAAGSGGNQRLLHAVPLIANLC